MTTLIPSARPSGFSSAISGEIRINLIRTFTILVIYSYHLVNFLWLSGGEVSNSFHARVTTLAIAWSCMVALLFWMARYGQITPRVQLLAALGDVLMVTGLVITAAHASSVFVAFYLLVIASSALRQSLRIVYVTTLAAVIGYGISLAYYVYVIVGSDVYYSDAALRVPRDTQVIFVLVLLTAGFLAGQSVRQFKRLEAALRYGETDRG